MIPTPLTQSTTRAVLTILCVALAARLLFFVAVHPWTLTTKQQLDLNNDSPGYHDLAVTLLAHGKFTRGIEREPDALRTPGYPLFVAGIYAIAGERPWAAMLAQLLLDAIACALLFRSLRRVIGDAAATWSAWFYALDPHLLLYGTLLLSDTLFVFVLVVALWLTVELIDGGYRRRDALLLGLALGVDTLIRPVGQYLPILVGGALLVLLRRELRRGLVVCAVLCGGVLIALLPWLARNQQQFGEFALSTSGAYNLLVLNVAPVEAAKRGVDFDTMVRLLMAEVDSLALSAGDDPATLSEFQRAEYWKRTALTHVQREPATMAAAYGKGVVFTFLNLGTADLVKSFGLPVTSLRDLHGMGNKLAAFCTQKSAAELLAALITALFLFVSYAAALRGCWETRASRLPRVLTMCAVFALYFMLIVGVGGLARFRLPVVPFYLPFVGMGAALCVQAIKQIRHSG